MEKEQTEALALVVENEAYHEPHKPDEKMMAGSGETSDVSPLSAAMLFHLFAKHLAQL